MNEDRYIFAPPPDSPHDLPLIHYHAYLLRPTKILPLTHFHFYVTSFLTALHMCDKVYFHLKNLLKPDSNTVEVYRNGFCSNLVHNELCEERLRVASPK
jgi:hypothetical protein